MPYVFNPFTGNFDYTVSSSGGGGSGQTWTEDITVESPDNTRTTFTTNNPYISGQLIVFLNGLRETHFTEASSTTFTLADPPVLGWEITLYYRTS